MIPIRDENPSRSVPVVAIGLIAANIIVFLYEVTLGKNLDQFVFQMGVTPKNILQVGLPAYPTLLTSMFLHGGWGHVLGNMLYLWIFGDNIEDFLGKIRFIIFYLVCGLIASFSHILSCVLNHKAMDVPSIGASGAISGILGAYILLYPKAKVLTLVPLGYYMRMVRLPAVAVLGMWILVQVFSGFASLPGAGQRGGTAFFAHIGGFAAGLVLIRLFGGRKKPVRVGDDG